MISHAVLPLPSFRLGFAEKLLIWLIILSLLLQPALATIPRPSEIVFDPPSESVFKIEDAPPVQVPYDLPDELVGKREIAALRTANSASFDMGDGQLAVLQESTPLHFQDGDGHWQPINPAFQQIAGQWINNSNSVRTSISSRSSAATIAGNSFSLQWLPQKIEWSDGAANAHAVATLAEKPQTGERSADARTVRYRQSWQMANQLPLSGFFGENGNKVIEDQWQSGFGQTEYTMRLNEFPALHWWQTTPETLDLRVQIKLPAGTTLKVDGKALDMESARPVVTRNPLAFVAANGEELILRPPTTFEQNNRSTAVQGSYVIIPIHNPQSAIHNTIELRVRTPYTWLSASERQFPVIIDPVFQVRGTTQIAEAYYDPANMAYKQTIVGKEGAWIGRLPSESARALLRFEMPKMPENTTVSKAYLMLAPDHAVATLGSAIQESSLFGHMTLHSIQPTSPEWWKGMQGEPTINLGAPFTPGEVVVSYSDGQETPAYAMWDVTGIVQSWNNTTLFEPANFGLLLRSTREQCTAPTFPLDPLCGAFGIHTAKDDWTFDELTLAQSLSNPNAPFIPNDASTRGVRLVVFYQGSSLTAGAVVNPGKGALPKSDVPPYFGADHLYTVPKLPNNKWQAVVARGLGPEHGPKVPTQPGVANAYSVYLRGSLPLKMQINDSESGAQLLDRKLGESVPVNTEAGYLLLNGRGTPTEFTDTDLQLRVGKNNGDPNDPTSQPESYDVRLINEQAQAIAPQLGVVKAVNYVFDSADPLALWNLVLPANSTSMVKIRLTGDGTRFRTYEKQFADKFRAQVVSSSNQQSMPASTGGTGTLAQWELKDGYTSSGFIMAGAGQIALALGYNGPRLTVYDEEDCGAEICQQKVIPIQYQVEIQVLSCGSDEYPTQGGTCQKVECPTNGAWAINSTTQQVVGGVLLWSKSGWSRNGGSGSSVNGGSAPLIGPSDGTAPTVAVLGGTISYQTPNTVNLSVDSTVMLVQCPALNAASGKLIKQFPVFIGAMTLSNLLPVFIPSPTLNDGQVLNQAWTDADQSDLGARTFFVGPTFKPSIAQFNETLKRVVGDQPNLGTLNFQVTWSLSVDGWSSLKSTITPRSGNPAPPDVVSLQVGLGDTFSLDATPADGNTPRTFKAVRASKATITQPEKMGGASKAVQAVILGRGAPIKQINKSCFASCLDLRALADSPDLVAPDRRWEMPDIITNVDAKTVMMSAAGNLTVFSTDHPSFENATNAGFSKEFNFEAGKASVSIELAPCGGIGPDVLVIQGAAEIKVPNVDAKMGASFMLCVSEQGVGLRSIHLSFESPVGIPLGQTGMFLTGLNGGVDIFPDYTKITVGLSVQAAPGGSGGALKITGQVSIDTRGLFELQATGKVIGTVDISGKLWVAWNPLDTGIEVEIGYKDWLKGFAKLHLWQGQGWQGKYSWLPDDDTMHFTGQIGATIKIKEGQIGDIGFMKLPPTNVEIKVEISFGEFCVSADCTDFEWGIKGRVEVAGVGVGVYYGFDSGFDFSMGNDGHILIDQFGATGLSAADFDGINTMAAPQQINGTATVSLTISPQAEEMLVTLGWQAGLPSLSLINPDGVEINASNANQFQAQVYNEASQALITVKLPKAGTWQAKINNLSEQGVEHYKLFFFSSKGAPGTPDNRGSFIAPAAANEAGNNSYLIRWNAPADTPETAKISLYSYPTVLASGVVSGNLHSGVPIVKNLPFKAGQFQWNTTGLLNGSYQIRAEVDDGINALPLDQISQPLESCLPDNVGLVSARALDPNRFPGTAVFSSTGTIAINDVTPPAAPTGLQLYPVQDAIMLRWNPSAETDVNSYLVSWGPRFINDIVVQYEVLVVASGTPEYRIPANNNGAEQGVHITALDVNGNASPHGTVLFYTTPSNTINEIPSTPLTPTFVSATSNSVSINITPGAGAVPAKYRVEVTSLAADGKQIKLDFANSNPTLPDLKLGVSYLVRLAAGNSDNWYSDYSPALKVKVSSGVDGNGDGMADDWAAGFGVSDANADGDGDGLNNLGEYQAGSNPTVQDSDGDGFSDGEEKNANSDPANSASYGAQYTQPRLTVDNDVLSFLAKKQAGGEAPTQSVLWGNIGGGQLTPQVTSDASWIKASLVNNMVQVGVDHNSLTPGYYSGIVKLGAAAGSDPLMGGAQCIRVNTWVLPADTDTTQATVKMIYLPLVSR